MGIEKLGECDKDPVWHFMQKLSEDEYIAARDYMRKKYHSVEPKFLLPGTGGVKMSKSTRQFWRRIDGERSDNKAAIIAKLLMYSLRHDATLVNNTGGWASVETLYHNLFKDGFVKNTLALLMHAISLLPKGVVEMQGVNACDAKNVYHKELRELSHDKRFLYNMFVHYQRSGVYQNEWDNGTVMPGAGEAPIITHIRVGVGHSVELVDVGRMFPPYMPEHMSKLHGAVLHLSDMDSIREMQCGKVPRSAKSRYGGAPFDLTYLMLGRSQPSALLDSLPGGLTARPGLPKCIPDDFVCNGQKGTLPSWLLEHQEPQDRGALSEDNNLYPKNGSWPRNQEHFFHIPPEGMPEYEAALQIRQYALNDTTWRLAPGGMIVGT